MSAAPDLAATLAGVMRADRGRILSALIARTGDFQLAEDALGDAAEAALVHWGRSGVPNRPLAWLIRVAFRKAIDRLRRTARDARERAALTLLARDEAEEDAEAIPDERLRLIFTCCHPALEPKTRVALTLRTLGGLTTAEVASAFLDRETAMAQRLSRARTKIAAAGIGFLIPDHAELAERLDSVLSVVYLIFNEGYQASSGDALVRHGLCDEAIYLARMLDQLMPRQAEIEGLLALILLTHARYAARTASGETFTALDQQDPTLWDGAMIAEGLAVLDRAVARLAPGPFQIQAAISALHIAGAQNGATDWRQIVLLYDSLWRIVRSSVVRLNRAVALYEVGGTDLALEELAALASDLDSYQPFHAASADLLARAGQTDAAIRAYDRAIDLCATPAQIRFLTARRDQLGDPMPKKKAEQKLGQSPTGR